MKSSAGAATIDRVVSAIQWLKLRDTTHQALLVRATLAAHRDNRREMDQALSTFRRLDGDEQPMYASRVHGLTRTFCALLEEDRGEARTEFDQALRAEETSPSIFQLSGRYGLNLLLRALAGDLDLATYQAVTADPASRLRWDRQFALFAYAVLAGRAGQTAQATEIVDEAVRVGAPYAMGVHLGLRLLSEAAIADGWGNAHPVAARRRAHPTRVRGAPLPRGTVRQPRDRRAPPPFPPARWKGTSPTSSTKPVCPTGVR